MGGTGGGSSTMGRTWMHRIDGSGVVRPRFLGDGVIRKGRNRVAVQAPLVNGEALMPLMGVLSVWPTPAWPEPASHAGTVSTRGCDASRTAFTPLAS